MVTNHSGTAVSSHWPYLNTSTKSPPLDPEEYSQIFQSLHLTGAYPWSHSGKSPLPAHIIIGKMAQRLHTEEHPFVFHSKVWYTALLPASPVIVGLYICNTNQWKCVCEDSCRAQRYSLSKPCRSGTVAPQWDCPPHTTEMRQCLEHALKWCSALTFKDA